MGLQGGLIGVVSTSSDESIRIYNNQTHTTNGGSTSHSSSSGRALRHQAVPAVSVVRQRLVAVEAGGVALRRHRSTHLAAAEGLPVAEGRRSAGRVDSDLPRLHYHLQDAGGSPLPYHSLYRDPSCAVSVEPLLTL